MQMKKKIFWPHNLVVRKKLSKYKTNSPLTLKKWEQCSLTPWFVCVVVFLIDNKDFSIKHFCFKRTFIIVPGLEPTNQGKKQPSASLCGKQHKQI